ncbi:hypothetical protein ABPG72_002152 [Tetrahymena utriculariae]
MAKNIQIAALLGIIIFALGAYYLYNTNNQKKVNTLGEWYACRSNSGFKICDDIEENEKKLKQCYKAATDFANICYPDHAQTTKECQNFWNFYNTQTKDALLPQDYFTCVQQGQKAAKESQFFYKNNYLVLWVDCATSKS